MKINNIELSEWIDADDCYCTYRYVLNADIDQDCLVIKNNRKRNRRRVSVHGRLSFIDKYINNIQFKTDQECKLKVDEILSQLEKLGAFL